MADAIDLKATQSAVDKQTVAVRAGMEKMNQAARNFAEKFSASMESVKSLGKNLEGVSSYVGKAVKDFASFGDSVLRGAAKAGVSTDEYQRMMAVAAEAGVSVDSFSGSMGKLSNNLSQVASGKNKGLVELCKQFQIPLRDAQGQMLSATALLPQLATAFASNQDPLKQAALGNALFGKSWREMLPVLGAGSESLAQSMARLQNIQGIVPPGGLQEADTFGKKLKDLSAVGSSFKAIVAQEMLPVLGPLIDKFVRWFEASKQPIGEQVRKIATSLGEALGKVDWDALLKSVSGFFTAFIDGIGKVGGVKTLLLGVLAVLGAPVVGALFGVIGAFNQLGRAVGPALVGKTGQALSFLRKQLVTVALGVNLGGMGAVWDIMTSSIGAAGRAVLMLGRALLLSPLGIVMGLATAALLIWQNWDAIKVWFSEFFTVTLPYAIGYAVGYLTTMFSQGFQWVSETVSSAVGTVIEWIASLPGAALAVVTSIGQFFVNLWNDPLGAVDGFIQGVKEKLLGVWEWIKGLWDGIKAIFSSAGASFEEGRKAGEQGAGGPGGDVNSVPITKPSAPLNLNTPSQATLNGQISVSFKDAPPGMRVEQAQANGGGVALNPNVGYRYTETMGA